jgi:FlaG/FlaF family flagellin (archaellin)
LISELLPGTTYHYRLLATNQAGTEESPDETFTTSPPTPPAAITAGASGVSQDTATISGTVSTNGLQTSYGFEIGTEAGEYGPATGLGSLGGATTEAVTVTLGELQPGTTYYYRVTAINADGTVYGEPQTFTTPGFPVLLTAPASLPLIATPAIAFPTGSQENTGSTKATTKKLTNAQKLAKALKACHAKKGKKRATCEAAAHRKYGLSHSP